MLRTFPACPPSGGPAGYSCYWRDPVYEALVSGDAAWGAVFAAAQWQTFVDFCIEQFAGIFAPAGSALDLGQATYVAYGRKNHLFAGSDGGGERWATVCPLLATAKLNDVEPYAYLRECCTRMTE